MKRFLLNLSDKQKNLIIVIISIILIIIFICIYKYYYDEPKESITVNQNTSQQENIQENEGYDYIEGNNETEKESKFGIIQKEKTITVHVIGEVEKPGVVNLKEGARIIDAINSCGGKTDNADITKINLAYVLEDGVQIYVPSIDDNSENIEYIKENAGENIIIESATQEDKKTTKVNINNASIEKLQTLPGIGESIAKQIIEYRKENGNFEKIEDLKNVSGIGDSKLEKIKEYIILK